VCVHKPNLAEAICLVAEAEELGDLVGCLCADFSGLTGCLLHEVYFHEGSEKVDYTVVVENARAY
jgi:hypothetical protein